jgi:hypothetical protein
MTRTGFVGDCCPAWPIIVLISADSSWWPVPRILQSIADIARQIGCHVPCPASSHERCCHFPPISFPCLSLPNNIPSTDGHQRSSFNFNPPARVLVICLFQDSTLTFCVAARPIFFWQYQTNTNRPSLLLSSQSYHYYALFIINQSSNV